MTVKEEAQLLERLRNGENAAYREILKKYGPMLLGYAARFVGNRDDAEEVVQEALVSIFDHIDRFEGRCSIRSWLFRIVHHKAVDHLRRTSRFVKPKEKDGSTDHLFDNRGMWTQPVANWDNSPEAQVNARKMLKIVQEQMNKLPHNYKEILLLREVYQMDTQEICNVLNITPVHTRVMLHRARQALYQAIDSYISQQESA